MDYARGIDVSRWDDNPNTVYKPDLAKAKELGVSFIGIKVSQNNKPDRMFEWFWKEAKERGLLRMPYHFYDYSTTKVHVTEQAKYFCGLLENDPPELPPVMDVEKYDYWGELPYREKLNSEIFQFFNVTDAFYKHPSMLYTNYSTIKYRLQPVPSWLLAHPLWIAYPASNLPDYTWQPWNKWTMWQYSFNGDGLAYGMESKSLDMNYYNGTNDDLWDYAIDYSPEPPAPEPTDAEKLNILWQEYKQTH